MPKFTLDRIEDLLVNALYREQRGAAASAQDLRAEAQRLDTQASDTEQAARNAFQAGVTALAEKHGVLLGDPGQVVYLRGPDGKATLEWPDPAPKLLPKKAPKTGTEKEASDRVAQASAALDHEPAKKADQASG